MNIGRVKEFHWTLLRCTRVLGHPRSLQEEGPPKRESPSKSFSLSPFFLS
ncbi:hypothetical protein LptCag_0200 [Leptospirillum ferriphilum]|uniref:Uncharacterized protein n=1 Tax=Leptospirillum ferriphilum TaxID=178606 RepID=A0A094WD70_9BACT|nr:hypothetical protein LptCag_0200 [Leptospirillum ferriphilum]